MVGATSGDAVLGAVGGVRDARVGIRKIEITGTDYAPGGAGGQGSPKVGSPGSSERKKLSMCLQIPGSVTKESIDADATTRLVG